MADLGVVYARTQAGLKEIRERAMALTREQRNLLIIVDGAKPLLEFAGMFGHTGEEMDALLKPLLDAGLITQARRAAEVPRPPAHAPEEAAAALVTLAGRLFGDKAAGAREKLRRANGSWSELGAAVDAVAKLARLTIDEDKALRFRTEAEAILRRGPA